MHYLPGLYQLHGNSVIAQVSKHRPQRYPGLLLHNDWTVMNMDET